MELDQLKYPIGKYQRPRDFSKDQINMYIDDIRDFPLKIKEVLEGLSDKQLDSPYRPEGWTIRQLVNHCADSHMNALTRFKLALTEDVPTIKPYFEALWADLPDSKTIEIDYAIMIIKGVHARWTYLLKSLSNDDLERNYFHPEQKREISLKETMALYSWHCRHHVAHISSLRKRED